MKISTIAYGRTYNLGEYESERIDLTAELVGVEQPEEAMQVLADTVEDMHDARIVARQQRIDQKGRERPTINKSW